MRVKTMEPILLLGKERFAGIDVRMRVKGGGQSAQVYAVRQALAKAVVAFAHKCEFGGGGNGLFFDFHNVAMERSNIRSFKLNGSLTGALHTTTLLAAMATASARVPTVATFDCQEPFYVFGAVGGWWWR